MSGADAALDDDKRLQNIINKLKKSADDAHIKEVSEWFLNILLKYKMAVFETIKSLFLEIRKRSQEKHIA